MKIIASHSKGLSMETVRTTVRTARNWNPTGGKSIESRCPKVLGPSGSASSRKSELVENIMKTLTVLSMVGGIWIKTMVTED